MTDKREAFIIKTIKLDLADFNEFQFKYKLTQFFVIFKINYLKLIIARSGVIL